MEATLTLSAKCGEWAQAVFDEVFSGAEVSADQMRWGPDYSHFGTAVLREEADEDTVKKAARLLAHHVKNVGLKRFAQLDLPIGVESCARFTNESGLSFRVCEVYQPPTVSEGGIAVAEMWIVRFDIAGSR